MYSIVMLAAMTSAPETPDFFKHKGGGCCGGYTATSCCGGYYAGGCCGGYYAGGCCGGYYGGHKFHGYPTVYGCCGGYSASCYGGYAYGGGCSGYSLYTPASGYTIPYSTPGNAIPGTTTPGGAGVTGTPSTGTPGTGTGPAPGSPGAPGSISSLSDTRAQVVVRTPANAKLFAEGQQTNLTGTERVFQTPELTAGKDFSYTMKIEYTEGTETKTATKQAVVRAGSRTVVDFLATDTETVTSPVTVTLPAKAKLFVDGSAATTTGGTHTFRTPDLTKGKPYVYQFRAEVERDGNTEIVSKEVSFIGGESIVVDFTNTASTRTAAR